jgi:hypothetical protein
MGHTQTVVIAAAMLRLVGAGYQILAERGVSAPALRGRNAVLIGDPQTAHRVIAR